MPLGLRVPSHALLFAEVLLWPFFAAPAHAELPLLPKPREVAWAQTVPVANGVSVRCPGCDAQDQFAAKDLTDAFEERGVRAAISAPVTVTIARTDSAEGRHLLGPDQFPQAMHDEGYILKPNGQGLAILAATSAGIFYGAQTAKQLVSRAPDGIVSLQLATVRDWPALRWRGLDDDLSRGPVPTLDFQKKQIRTIAAYKVNVYSPYFEHTMQYRSDPLAAPPGGSMSPADARELVAYAAQYHVLIIPEQEAFGHLHYMLNWEMYSPLSEAPQGEVLAPGAPGVLPFIRRIFDQLAEDFPGPFLHIGADETFELGKGATRPDVDRRGLGAVYLDFLQRIVETLKPLNRRYLFWGDIAMHEPALVKALPESFKKQVIAVAWEYNPHPSFAPYIKPYTDAGLECWVAPGVNDWNRVYPDNNLALANIQGFTAEGQASHCTGQLNTVWDDDGESLFNGNWYGVLFGAAAAWQPGTSSIPDFQRSYGAVFHGDTTGKIDQAQRELMAAHQLLNNTYSKSADANDFLFWLDPWTPEGQRIAEKVRPVIHDLRLHAERAIVLVREAREAAPLREQDALDVMELGARKVDFIGLKFQIADEAAVDYSKAYAVQSSKVKTDRADLMRYTSDIAHPNNVGGKLGDLLNTYLLLGDLYQQAWLKSYRPYYLHVITQRYTLASDLWAGRADRVRAARRNWNESATLPPASELGIPLPASRPGSVSSPPAKP